jgi:hypothetical protein
MVFASVRVGAGMATFATEATITTTFVFLVLNQLVPPPFSSMAQVDETIVVVVAFVIRVRVFVRNALVKAQPSMGFDRMQGIWWE